MLTPQVLIPQRKIKHYPKNGFGNFIFKKRGKNLLNFFQQFCAVTFHCQPLRFSGFLYKNCSCVRFVFFALKLLSPQLLYCIMWTFQGLNHLYLCTKQIIIKGLLSACYHCVPEIQNQNSQPNWGNTYISE